MPPNRREFLKSAGIAGTALIANRLGDAPVLAQSDEQSIIKMAQTEVLEIGYEEHGDAGASPVILLHGFPYDVRSFDGVVPPLVQAGYRILVPYLRGYGPTRLRDLSLPRMAEQAAIAQDLIDFADGLGLEQFAVAGFDWGNRAACIAAILYPERIKAQVAIGGYSVQNTLVPGGPAPAALESMLWYQWYFNTDRGVEGLSSNRHDIIRHLWNTWSPQWNYSDEDYQRSAPSFDNPDFVDMVIHSYRHRHVNAPGEERFLEIERRLALRPRINVPAIVLRAADSGFGAPSANPAGDEAS